jgi:D-sedoheptulose 7-phosphate isomerase
MDHRKLVQRITGVVVNIELSRKRASDLRELLLRWEEICVPQIDLVATALIEVLLKGNKILICGNGGSAADSQHFAAELVGTLIKENRRIGLAAISLTTDSSILTAYSNDYSFEEVFARQVEAIGISGDALVLISTSGNSKNCLQAMKKARSLGIVTIALTGQAGQLVQECDLSITVPSSNTQLIQECHVLTYHVISELIDNAFS